jgi:hypothetical protein
MHSGGKTEAERAAEHNDLRQLLHRDQGILEEKQPVGRAAFIV